MSSGRAVVSGWAASARDAVAAHMGSAARGQSRAASVLVTGSSGKGTTCRMLAEVLRAARLHPIVAGAGATPWPAVASALIEHAESGRPRTERRAIRLIEVDAADLRQVIRRETQPTALVCTNILRGQRDDGTARAALTARLERVIRSLPVSTTLILNADDPQVANLARDTPNPRLYFGISDPVHARVRPDPAAEVRYCPRCGDQLAYACMYYAGLGHWACGGCGLSRPEPDVSVTKIVPAGSSSSRIQVAHNSSKSVLEVPLPGIYNIYNALAAMTVATHLNMPAWSLRAVENVSGGPMRMERTHVAGHDIFLAVATNATGYTEVLRAILGDAEPRRMVLGLSARRQPRQDLSWIWDVDFEGLAGLAPAPVICGNRAADLGVRLKYAGWLGDGRDRGHAASARIEPDPVRAVRQAIAETPSGQPLWVVSTATALAEIRRWLHHHDGDVGLEAETSPRRIGPRRTGPRPTVPLPTGPQPTGPQPSGPHPSGPPRSAPQPTAPPRSRHRSGRGGRDRTGHRQPRQPGAAR
jgi:lipid II isoglutaminyl synthase (glutamine-hydrolysing)